MAGTGASLTYEALDRRSDVLARIFAARGCAPGDNVAVLLHNDPAYFEVAWAAQRSGLRLTPVNWHLAADEVRYVVEDCGARVVVSSTALVDLANLAVEGDEIVRFLVDGAAPGWEDLRTAVEGPTARYAEAEGLVMFYSSGTTGRPKGIVRPTAGAPYGTGTPTDRLMGGRYGFDADVVYLSPAPLYHAAPLAWSMGTHRRGGTVVLMNRFDPVAALAAIERFGVTHAQFVPTMFVRLLKLDGETRRRHDVRSLRMVIHAAAPCPVDVKQQMIDWWGPVIHEYYAGSEGVGFVAIGPEEWMRRPGSVGRSLRGPLHILDEDGNALPPGQSGVVWFESDARFEYHGDPEKTSSAFNERGWATLGDIGYLDEDGYLFLTDRATDLIISGGVNIYPQEVEQALLAHPAVLDAGVVGAHDAEFGESVVAFVELVSRDDHDPVIVDELHAFLRERLAGFKCPRQIVVTDDMPRLPTGKLLRRRLRERLSRSASPAP